MIATSPGHLDGAVNNNSEEKFCFPCNIIIDCCLIGKEMNVKIYSEMISVKRCGKLLISSQLYISSCLLRSHKMALENKLETYCQLDSIYLGKKKTGTKYDLKEIFVQR